MILINFEILIRKVLVIGFVLCLNSTSNGAYVTTMTILLNYILLWLVLLPVNKHSQTKVQFQNQKHILVMVVAHLLDKSIL